MEHKRVNGMRRQKFSLVNAICFVSLLSTVSFDLLAITYEYDALSRLTSVTYDNGDKISYNYDPAGNITKTISAQVGVDSDNDGIDDTDDAFPDNPNETLDIDGDNIGNNEDLDDDNDGVSDEDEIAQGTDPLVADNDSEEGENIVLSDLLSGHVTFKDADDNDIAVPADAWVGITPSVYQGDENGWNRVRCSIDVNGDFGQACYLFEDELGMREAFSDVNETYQIVVFKNHVEPQENNWNCGEDVYGGAADNSWSEIVVRPQHYSDRSQEQCSASNPDTDTDTAALDVDKSGSINSFDLLLIQRHIGSVSNVSANIQLPTNVGGAGLDGRMTNDELKDAIESMFLKASLDVDGDGDTDGFDLLMIQRHLGGVSNVSVNILLPTGVNGEDLDGAYSNDEIRQAIEHVLSQSDAAGITLPFSFSKFQIGIDDNGGIKIKRKENIGTYDGVFTHTEYHFDAVYGTWDEPIETNADSRYNLVEGQWLAVEEANDGTVSVSGSIATFPEVNAKLAVISTQDLSNTTQTIPDFKIDVTFSEGAESYSLGFDHAYEAYRLESSVRHGDFDSAQSDYVNLLEFINAQSNNYWFLGADDEFNGGGSFQKPTASTIQDGSTGNLIEWNDTNGQASGVIGTWTVSKIPGTEIIAVFIDLDDAHRYRYTHQENYFYTYHSTAGKVYEGRHLTVQGEFEDTGEVNYNNIAAADINAAIEAETWTGVSAEPQSIVITTQPQALVVLEGAPATFK
jgi:YD repeat-containing protein